MRGCSSLLQGWLADLEGPARRGELGAGPAPCRHGAEQALHSVGEGLQVLTAQHHQRHALCAVVLPAHELRCGNQLVQVVAVRFPAARRMRRVKQDADAASAAAP